MTDDTPRTVDDWLPGDPDKNEQIARMIRVDHAGEFGAARIYAGQLEILGRAPAGAVIREMAEQEERHLETFSTMMADRRIRPTALMPLWHVAGYVLGATTALMGEKAAMACTVAVEEIIDEHYRDQAAALGEAEPELKQTIEEFRADELAHRDTGLRHGAEDAPAYELLSAAIKTGSRVAIWLSTRI